MGNSQMNKTDLIEAITNEADVSKKQANAVVDAFTNAVTKALANKETVSLIGFGSFSVKERAERAGRNPSTGAAITIKAATVPSFKAGSSLKDAVNQ